MRVIALNRRSPSSWCILSVSHCPFSRTILLSRVLFLSLALSSLCTILSHSLSQCAYAHFPHFYLFYPFSRYIARTLLDAAFPLPLLMLLSSIHLVVQWLKIPWRCARPVWGKGAISSVNEGRTNFRPSAPKRVASNPEIKRSMASGADRSCTAQCSPRSKVCNKERSILSMRSTQSHSRWS